MALADYRLCDVCGAKVSVVTYSLMKEPIIVRHVCSEHICTLERDNKQKEDGDVHE